MEIFDVSGCGAAVLFQPAALPVPRWCRAGDLSYLSTGLAGTGTAHPRPGRFRSRSPGRTGAKKNQSAGFPDSAGSSIRKKGGSEDV